jgi:Bacterial Ig-like domain (group 3)
MARRRNKRVRSLSRVAGVGAVLALVATAVMAAPAVSAGNRGGSGKGKVTKVAATAAAAGHRLKHVHAGKGASGSGTGNSQSSAPVQNTTPATVTLSSSVPTGLVTGQAVSFTATVTTGGAPATGKIIFSVVGSNGTTATCDGGNKQPLVTSAGVTSATCSFAKGLKSEPLNYTVTGTLKDPNFTGSATLVQQITKSLTHTTVKDLTGEVIAGEAFSFNAVVQDTAPGTGAPTGSMEFAVCPDFSTTCTGGPGGTFTMGSPTKWDKDHNQNGFKFTIPAGVLTPGFYDVSADYVGNSNYWSSQSSFSFILVDPVPTTMRLVMSDNPTFDGGREILRASVHGDSRATQSLGGPTGTVTFTITGASGDTLTCEETGTDVIQIGVKAADQGVARCTISGEILAADSPYTISAVYSGDSVYNASSHPDLELHVVDHP